MTLTAPISAPISAPKAILFDWDNTLVDTWPCIHDAMTATFEAMGQTPWTFAEFKKRLGPSMRDSFPALFGDRWEEAGDIFHAAFAEKHLDRLAVFPGALEVLRKLQAQGTYMAVVSNKTGRHLRAEARHLGWEGYFAELVGASDAIKDKPNADPAHKALNGSGVPAGSDVWFIGDALTDMECAYNSGCFAVLLRAEPPKDGEFAQCPPQLHLTDCAALTSLLDQLAVHIGKK